MNIIEILEELGIEYREAGQHHHSSPGWVQISCPFCGEDNFKLGISINYGNCNCWSSGSHSLASTLTQASGQPFSKIKELLQGFDRGIWEEPEQRRGELVLPEGVGSLSHPHISYLRSRGFDPDILVKLWNIQGIAHHPTLSWRLFIPVYFRGKVVSWTTRSLVPFGKRYVAARACDEAVPSKSLLYGFDYARHAIVVVEGPTDVWRIGPGACATFGTSFTDEQVARISRFPLRAICFDAEEEAQRQARKLMETLSALPGKTTNIILDSGKDPGEAEEWEIQQLRRSFLE